MQRTYFLNYSDALRFSARFVWRGSADFAVGNFRKT